jgi:chromosome segregation ATPase|tara:strand:- start:344 stop:574 length:231 start_codon:yes stop_codon:yes gene_type:complete
MSQKDLLRELKLTIADMTKEKNDAIELASTKDTKIKQILTQLEQATDDVKAMGKKIAELETKLDNQGVKIKKECKC